MDVAAVWFTGVSALAALGALVWAVLTTRKEHAVMRREEAHREAELQRREALERRQQAEQIAAIVHVEPKTFQILELDALKQDDNATYRRRHHAWANVYNASSLPVYDVDVHLSSRDTGKVKSWSTPIVAPGQCGHVHLPAMRDRSLHEVPLSMSFRDNAGRRWHKGPDGAIHEEQECDDLHPMVGEASSTWHKCSSNDTP